MKKVLVFVLLIAGCGTAKSPESALPPTLDAKVLGQYDLVLTSTNGHATTNIYTNFTQNGTTFTGGADTLVCPSNDLSLCFGNDLPVISVIPSGTVNGMNVTITIIFPNMVGADTVSMVGKAAGSDLAGTYADTRGDAGTWTGIAASSLGASYSGTFHSTTNPLPSDPTIALTLAQDSGFHLTGTATITNSPCINSLTFSGQAIGEAFSLTDAVSKAVITAVPTGGGFNFSYNFDSTAPNCAGDSGHGFVTTNQSPWDY